MLVKVGSLPQFPDGDPVLAILPLDHDQDAQGAHPGRRNLNISGCHTRKFLRGPIPDPSLGRQHRASALFADPAGGRRASTIEVVLNYALIPEPEPELKAKYLATLPTDQDAAAKKVIEEYIQPRMLTYRANH